MLQQRQQRLRRAPRERRLGDQPRQHAGRRRAERPAGGIVDLDPPALQLDRHPARQAAVRRDQRGDLARRLGRAAQDRGDGERLLALVRRLDDADMPSSASAFSSLGKAGALAPALGRAGRAHRFRDEAARGCERRRRPRRAARHRSRRTPSVSSSFFRPYCGWPAPAGSRSLGPIGVPALGVEVLVETGQHDGAVRQPRDRGEQRRRRRHRAGRAGGDDRRRRAVPRQAAPPRARISRSRRTPGSISPRSARCAGQNSVAIRRNSSVISQ